MTGRNRPVRLRVYTRPVLDSRIRCCCCEDPLFRHKMLRVSDQQLANATGRIVSLKSTIYQPLDSHNFRLLELDRQELPREPRVLQDFPAMQKTNRQAASCDFSSVVLSQSNFRVRPQCNRTIHRDKRAPQSSPSQAVVWGWNTRSWHPLLSSVIDT